MKRILTISLLIAGLCGCAETPDPCRGKDVYLGMPADQALPILRQCGKLTSEGVGGIALGGMTFWLFRDRSIFVTEKQGVMTIGNLR